MEPFSIHSKRVALPDGIQDATITILNGRIDSILPGEHRQEGIPFETFGDKVIMPGVIDAHVHINEPGRTEWEGADSASKAAAAGGVTTMIEMPLNASPVTTTLEAFQLKQAAVKDKLHVDCGYYGGVIPDNIDDLDALLGAGVFGIKAFLTHSGINEFPNVTETDLRRAMPILKEHDAKLLVHCELESPITDAWADGDHRSYQNYLHSRPKKWENDAVELMIRLGEEFDVHVHIVHVSSAEALTPLRAAKSRGARITAETCPHYLVFNSEVIQDGAVQFKCAPPIRQRANNELLWDALKDGTLDFIASDHSPAPPEIKKIDSGDFRSAWGGIAGLQFTLPAFWTAAKERGFSIEDLVRLLCHAPAQFLGLQEKGTIHPGFVADLVIWDPDAEFTVRPEGIHHRYKLTPYAGMKLTGLVERTILGGREVYRDGIFVPEPQGRILFRTN